MNFFKGNSCAPARLLATVILLFTFSATASAQGDEVAIADISSLKKLSIEELMNVEVTLLTKQPQSLNRTPASINVITGEDIRRSPSQRLPEALRLLPNIQVSQITAPHYTINARGFNAPFANKMLVMIDGRTVYSPMWAGVFWDVQNVLLEDIDRVEAISGPGGSLWGANAVNGIINVISKSSRETQGLYVTEAYGSFLRHHRAARYGGKLGSKITYRVFGQYYEYDDAFVHVPEGVDLPADIPANDAWSVGQGGFRMDIQASQNDDVVVEGNYYQGRQFTVPRESTFDGQSLLGRWNHKFSSGSGFKLQAYFDRTWRRDVPSTISDQLHTYDVDFQYHLNIGLRHNLLMGAGYRYMDNLTLSPPGFGIMPAERDMPLASIFVQDVFTLIPERLEIHAGSKFLHNTFTGFEVQPSLRISYMKPGYTLWGALSRAVRTPSRFDVDYKIPPFINGGPDFESEKLVAYELGFRIQRSELWSLSLATFYNNYNKLYSVESTADLPMAYYIKNGTEGYSTGMEFSGILRLFPMWRLRGGYTFFYKDLWNSNYDHSVLGFDAAHQVKLHSMLDLPGNLQLDVTSRYISELSGTTVPEYFATDVELAWLVGHFEFSLTGKNLFDKNHLEFPGNEIPRSLLGRITWRY